MSRRSQVLFGAFSIVLAAGLSAVGGIPLVPSGVFGAFLLALTIVLLAWHRLALRAHRESDVVIFSRGAWPVIISLVLIEAICALDILLAPVGSDRVWLFLGYFLLGIAFLAFMPSALAFWVADSARLTSQVLAFKRALPWQDIDWLYLESNETTQKQYHITIARWKDEQLIVEAGPQRSLEVLVRTPLSGGAPSPILQAIRARATHAAFGIDQLPAVQARRRGQTFASSSQPEPNVSLQDAVGIARGPSMPASWTRFSVRQGIIWPNLLIFTFLAVLAVAGGMFIVMSGTIIGLDMVPPSWLVGSGRSLVLLGEGLLCAGFGGWLFFSISLQWLRTLRHPQDYFFLVTPRYVAEVKGKKVDGVSLADVQGIQRSGGGNYGWKIVLAMRNGKKQEYDVGSNYGPARDLYAYILAALNARRPAQPAAPYGATMRSDAEA
ncbi:MAG: hypothetical protein ACM3N4_07995 [Nitrososphaerota archaeon]